jgi:DNA (cytosine-5)-methyltransferase 1
MTQVLKSAVSLFSGCGGFDWGVKSAGVDIIWANDIDPHAAAAYKALFPETEFHLGDVRDIATFPEADVLIGCYPCTGFSLGSRRRNRDGADRDLKANGGNYLYEEFVRALSVVQPAVFFIENVGGMTTASDGWFFEKQLTEFRRQGYVVNHKVLDASSFGAAQTRKRLFIVGVKQELGTSFTFPEPTHGQADDLKALASLRSALTNVKTDVDTEVFNFKFHGHYLTRNRKRPWESPSYTIVANAHHVPLHPSGEPMRRVGVDHWELQGDVNRRLSWRECAAIQGLPPQVAPSGTLLDKYRVVGNAVPPVFGKTLMEEATAQFGS